MKKVIKIGLVLSLCGILFTGCTDDTKNEIIAKNGNYVVKMPYMGSTRDMDLKVSNNDIQLILGKANQELLGTKVGNLMTCKKVIIMMRDNIEHLTCKKDGKEESQIEYMSVGKIIKKPN